MAVEKGEGREREHGRKFSQRLEKIKSDRATKLGFSYIDSLRYRFSKVIFRSEIMRENWNTTRHYTSTLITMKSFIVNRYLNSKKKSTANTSSKTKAIRCSFLAV